MTETDVVVLGSGAAGLSAALTAAVGGAAVTFGHVAGKSVLADNGLSDGGRSA
jgi:succinate dehydrogenase/fumarate reductase flavoprotein subunit